jgi:hypothetical protein
LNILNIHSRTIPGPHHAVAALFRTLASDHDLIIPAHKWPAVKLDDGLRVGSNGGHGPIGYSVVAFEEDRYIQFKFSKPIGFHGTHAFEIMPVDAQNSLVRHTIQMRTSGLAVLTWAFVIRWLHDAYLEDTLDQIENHFTGRKKRTEWNWWVRLLRRF